MLKKAISIIMTLICIASIAFGSWIALSWVDIVSDNISGNPTHDSNNIIVRIAWD